MQSFDAIGIAEVRTLTVGFKRLLGTGVTFGDSDLLVSIDFYEFSEIKTGTPSDLLNGTAQANDASVTIKGTVVPAGQAALQSIDGSKGVAGAEYAITFSASVIGQLNETITESVTFKVKDLVPE